MRKNRTFIEDVHDLQAAFSRLAWVFMDEMKPLLGVSIRFLQKIRLLGKEQEL